MWGSIGDVNSGLRKGERTSFPRFFDAENRIPKTSNPEKGIPPLSRRNLHSFHHLQKRASRSFRLNEQQGQYKTWMNDPEGMDDTVT